MSHLCFQTTFKRFGQSKLATFVLSITKDIISLKPKNYRKSIKGKKIDKWLIVM